MAFFARSWPITYSSSLALIIWGAGMSFKSNSGLGASFRFFTWFFFGISVFTGFRLPKSLRFMFMYGIF